MSPWPRWGALVLLALTAWTVSAAPPQSATGRDRDIDAAFDEVMARYHLPGLALGVVVDDRVVYVRTAGELDAGGGQPVTPDTLFKIASNSKAMTSALLARLVDAGKLRWDDPVVKYLPQFRMHDPWVTQQMQVRDLLIHNTGLRAGAGDLMLWPEPNSFTRADVLRGLAYLKPQRSFRAGYDYDNLMYIIAGEVAAAAGGAPYETLIRRELFEPLRMTRCQVGEWRPSVVGNVAQPHMRQGEANVPVRADGDVVHATTMEAAGGIRCSLNDMLTWVRMWLTPDATAPRLSTAWLSTAQRQALWSPQMPMPLTARMRAWDNGHFSAYGYGWRLADVDGVFKVSHTGTLMGMYSAVTLLPDRRTGFVLLINGEGDEARTALNQTLVKHFVAPQQQRTVAYYAQQLADERAHTPPARRPPDTSMRQPATPAEMRSWLGHYRDPWFGEVTLCQRDGAVRFVAQRSPMLSGTVQRVGERWLVDWDDVSVDVEAWLDFTRPAAKTATMTMTKVDSEADFSYDYEDLAFTRSGGCD